MNALRGSPCKMYSDYVALDSLSPFSFHPPLQLLILFCSTYSERFVFRMGEIGVRGVSARAQHNDLILGKWAWTTRSCYPPKSHTMYTRSPTGPKVNNPTFILDLLPKKFLFIHCFTVDNRPTTSKCILRFDVPFVSSVSFSGFHLLFIADFER